MSIKNRPLAVSSYVSKISVHPTDSTVAQKPLMNECYHYRNNGCEAYCGYQHVPEHKGIDRNNGPVKPNLRIGHKSAKTHRTSSPTYERRLSTDDEKNNSPARSNSSSSQSEIECKFHRKGACSFGASCRYLHIPENHGIDAGHY